MRKNNKFCEVFYKFCLLRLNFFSSDSLSKYFFTNTYHEYYVFFSGYNFYLCRLYKLE